MRLTYVVAESEEQFNKFKDSTIYKDKGCCIWLTDSCQIKGQTLPEVVVLSKNVPKYTEMERVIKLTRITAKRHYDPIEVLPEAAYV